MPGQYHWTRTLGTTRKNEDDNFLPNEVFIYHFCNDCNDKIKSVVIVQDGGAGHPFVLREPTAQEAIEIANYTPETELPPIDDVDPEMASQHREWYVAKAFWNEIEKLEDQDFCFKKFWIHLRKLQGPK
jgi:hypothetical protein